MGVLDDLMPLMAECSTEEMCSLWGCDGLKRRKI